MTQRSCIIMTSKKRKIQKIKPKHANTYMNIANFLAGDSHCERLKVGCVIVKDNNIIASACNGTLENRDNCCEITPDLTKPETIHAEAAAIAKLAGSSQSAKNSTLFVTTLPCESCATLIATAQISHVYYLHEYRSLGGLDILKGAHIQVTKIAITEE